MRGHRAEAMPAPQMHMSLPACAPWPDAASPCLPWADHCKLHGADVTTRLLAILSRTGLADLYLARGKAHSPQVGLMGMVAAMVHDYGAPPATALRPAPAPGWGRPSLRAAAHPTPETGHPQVTNTFLIEQVRARSVRQLGSCDSPCIACAGEWLVCAEHQSIVRPF